MAKSNVIYIDENGKAEGWFKKTKRKLGDAAYDAKIKTKAFIEICKENKEQTIAIAAIVVPAITETIKMVARANNKREDNDHRKLEIWDPVEGHWWKLRRELRTSEYLELEQRVKDGESRGEVLEDMGVLKK